MYKKGSEWRKWDLHFHTPSSFDYEDMNVSNQDIINNLKEKEISVVAITDHHYMDIARIMELQSLGEQEGITVLPGIEFRSELGGSEIVHFIGIFSENSNIEEIWTDIQSTCQLKPSEIQKVGDDRVYNDLKDTASLIHKLGGLVSVHAGKKTNTIENIKNNKEYKMQIKVDLLLDYIDILEIGNPEVDIEGYNTIVFPDIGFERPMIICSDNHNIYNYDFKESCWIKADPTFEGLNQITYECKERVFIGNTPELIERVTANKTKFIKSIEVTHEKQYDGNKGTWFRDIEIPINFGLVAIIGNKGSGKSAVADILGLCGNSHNYFDFSFLNKKRFLKNNLAKNFKGSIVWANNDKSSKNLISDVDLNAPERVRYLPQSYFDRLTNNLDNYDFQKTLEDIVFSYLPDEEKLGRNSFSELISYKEESISKDIELISNEILDINKNLLSFEDKLHPSYKEKLEKELEVKEKELEEHIINNPPEVTNPEIDEDKKEHNKIISTQIKENNSVKDILTSEIDKNQNIKIALNQEIEELENIQEDFKRFDSEIKSFFISYKTKLDKYELSINSVLKYEINLSSIEKKIDSKKSDYKKVKESLLSKDVIESSYPIEKQKEIVKASIVVKLSELNLEINKLKGQLSEPFKKYQDYLDKFKKWQNSKKELEGSKEIPQSINWYKNELDYLENKLPKVIADEREERVVKSQAIWSKKLEIVNIYNKLKISVDTEIEDYKDILGDYDINIDVSLKIKQNFSSSFLGFINQNKKGSFFQIDDGRNRIEKMMSQVDHQRKDGIEKFLKDVIENLEFDKRKEHSNARRYINEQINNEKILDFYNFLFSLGFLVPSYELKLGEKHLTELSPGEKGAMLIVFYLMLDKNTIPLIIDQPEENLDNESIYKVLVHFIRDTKKRRQVILVTHNPNLAIVGDAEQIIYVNIDKKDKNTFNYESGAIENAPINKHASDILEGTLKAFDIRRLKYLKI